MVSAEVEAGAVVDVAGGGAMEEVVGGALEVVEAVVLLPPEQPPKTRAMITTIESETTMRLDNLRI